MERYVRRFIEGMNIDYSEFPRKNTTRIATYYESYN